VCKKKDKRKKKKKKKKKPHPQQLGTRQHTLLEARIQKINMIPQKLINRRHLVQLALQRSPIRLQHLKRRKRQYLLHKRQHSRSQQTNT